MRKRLLMAGGVVLVIFLTIWGVVGLRKRPVSSTSEQTPSSSGQASSAREAQAGAAPHLANERRGIMADILEQGLTPDRAKLLFSMVVGPLPGVTVPPGSADPSDRDGTLAVSYIYQVWDSLTPEQRAAASRLIHRPETVQSGRSTGAAHVTVLKLVAFNADPFTPAFDFQYRSDDANQFLAVQLSNIAPIARITAVVDNDPPPGAEYAHTWMWAEDESPDPRGCVIYYHNQKFVGLSPEDAQSIVTHEVVHCYQQRVAGTVTQIAKLHAWIAEGEACWVEFTTNPNASYDATGMPNWWTWYLYHPETLYVKRSDDGIGVFGHMSDLAGDTVVWSRLLPVVQADISTAGSFNVLTEGYQTEYYTTWGASYFKVSGKKPWTMLGPGKLPDTGPPPQEITVGPHFADLLRADSDISALFKLSGSADIVTVSLMTGYGRLHDSNFSLDTALDSSAPLILCFKPGGCKCPDGSEGASLFTKPATAPVSIGINGGETTSQLGVVGDSLDHFCKNTDPKQPPPPGGGGGGGGGGGDDNPPQPPPAPPGGASWGDTHLETFDGLGYDFQVVGEYTLARSTKDDFLVQVRQVPVLGPKIASVNQAVATRIGGQRLTFTMENSALVLRIDGKVVSGPPPRLKVGSLTGATTAFGGTYILTWPDNTVLKVEQLGSYAINVRVRPAASRKGTLAGLLGDFNGSPDNDLVGQNNAKLGLSREDLNQKLASAWRLNKAMSLFDYQPGQSPASFFDPDFPAKDADAARLANRATAEKTCREHGITDQRLLDDCILDLAVTNSFVFGSQYAHAQQVLAARAALARPTSAPEQRLFWVDGEILDSKSEPEYHFQGKKGDVIWVGHDPNCRNAGTPAGRAFLALLDQTGKQLGSQDACDFGRLELPVAGTYTFKGIFKYQSNTVHYHVPVRMVRPDRHQQISYGQAVSGNIEQWAVHDVYTWSGKAGDLIVLSGQGCQLNVFTSIIDPDGHDFLGPSCRTGTYWKVPKDGTYQLVVNGGEWAHAEITGPYRFVFQGGKLAQ